MEPITDSRREASCEVCKQVFPDPYLNRSGKVRGPHSPQRPCLRIQRSLLGTLRCDVPSSLQAALGKHFTPCISASFAAERERPTGPWGLRPPQAPGPLGASERSTHRMDAGSPLTFLTGAKIHTPIVITIIVTIIQQRSQSRCYLLRTMRLLCVIHYEPQDGHLVPNAPGRGLH